MQALLYCLICMYLPFGTVHPQVCSALFPVLQLLYLCMHVCMSVCICMYVCTVCIEAAVGATLECEYYLVRPHPEWCSCCTSTNGIKG